MLREDIEHPDDVVARVKEGLRDLPHGPKSSLLVAHYGVLQLLLMQLGFEGVRTNTGGCLGLELTSEGEPHSLISYWSN